MAAIAVRKVTIILRHQLPPQLFPLCLLFPLLSLLRHHLLQVQHHHQVLDFIHNNHYQYPLEFQHHHLLYRQFLLHLRHLLFLSVYHCSVKITQA